MPRSVASDLVLHRLPMSHKKDAMLKWVKIVGAGATVLMHRLICSFVISINQNRFSQNVDLSDY